jgi:hypothetical protein
LLELREPLGYFSKRRTLSFEGFGKFGLRCCGLGAFSDTSLNRRDSSRNSSFYYQRIRAKEVELTTDLSQ